MGSCDSTNAIRLESYGLPQLASVEGKDPGYRCFYTTYRTQRSI
jgi:hypothetical protein